MKQLFKTISICFVVCLLLQLVFHGIPLVGLPKLEEISYAEIRDVNTDALAVASTEEDLEMARNLANFLNYLPGRTGDNLADYEIRYVCKDGTEVVLSANEETVFYRNQAHAIQGDNGEIFENIMEGWFFPE